jgi:hypothetical protein
MIEHRLVILPRLTPKGPWRTTRREALEDAIAHGLGDRDAYDARRIWLTVPAEIETRWT